MRILHVTPYYYPALRYGGPVRSVHGLCRSLAELGHDIRVYTTDLDGPARIGHPPGVPIDVEGVAVRYFPARYCRRLFFSPEMGRELSRRIDLYDLVHIHTFFSWPTHIAASIAARHGVPYILTPRGMLVKDLVRRKSRLVKSAWIRITGRRVVEGAARIHATTDIEKEEIRRFNFKLPEVFVIPVGVDPADKFPGSGGPVSPTIEALVRKIPLLLFLGRINWKKGLDRLIPALRYLEGVHLAVAGNDEDNYRIKLDRLASRNGVSGRLTFTGAVYGEEKRRLFGAADVFVLPSYSENFGIAVLEAMAAGLPVVVTPEVGLSREVEESGAGLVLNGDPGVLGPGIKDLLADPVRLKEMGERGRELAARRYAWSGIAREMEKVYQQVIGEKL
ncbi:MAG: glycosyltransferase [Candidatus Erginobacter occultus]|nr:glycosyltransferase [Candidatus Erginobacter occultus]